MRIKYSFSFLLMLFLVIGAFRVAASPVQFSLEMMGLEKGITNSVVGTDSTVFFKIPPKRYIDRAFLDLQIRYSTLLSEPSYITVLSEGVPITTVRLEPAGAEKLATSPDLVVLNRRVFLPKRFLKSVFLPVQFQLRATVTGEPCKDAEIAKNLIAIMPSSHLEISYREVPATIGEFVNSLPENVNILYPENRQLNLNEIKLLASFESFLLRSNRASTYTVKNTEKAHVFIGTWSEFESFRQSMLNQIEKSKAFTEGDATSDAVFTKARPGLFAQTVGDKTRRILYINSDYIQDSSLFSEELLSLADATFLEKGQIKRTITKDQLIYRDDLRLAARGGDIENGYEWNINLSPRDIGHGFSSEELQISAMIPPTPENLPAQVYVFENEELIESITASGKNSPQLFSVSLNGGHLDLKTNIKIRIVRSEPKGVCGSDFSRPEVPVRLMPDTALKIGSLKPSSLTLARAAHVFWRDVKVYIPVDMKATAPHRVIRKIGYLLKELDLLTHKVNLQEYEPASALQFDSPSIVLSQQKTPKGVDWPLTSGDLESLSVSRLTSYSLDGIRNSAALQLADFGGFPVVNFHTTSDLFPIKSLPSVGLSRENLIVFNEERIVLRTFSERPLIKQKVFGKENIILKAYEEYRYVIWGCLWLLLTLVFIRVSGKYRK